MPARGFGVGSWNEDCGRQSIRVHTSPRGVSTNALHRLQRIQVPSRSRGALHSVITSPTRSRPWHRSTGALEINRDFNAVVGTRYSSVRNPIDDSVQQAQSKRTSQPSVLALLFALLAHD